MALNVSVMRFVNWRAEVRDKGREEGLAHWALVLWQPSSDGDITAISDSPR